VTGGLTHTITVRVEPSYPVLVGPGLVPRLAELLAAAGVDLERRVALVSDETVAALYGAAVAEALAAAGATLTEVTVAPGEGSKSLPAVEQVCSEMSRAGIDRGGLVVALGGGVVGDLAGFVAAAYLRGLPFVQLPTSLLAMVDASVGGKTGVNLPEGKNLVGAFHQPLAVLADTALLATLPARVLREGAVELVKAGLIGDPSLLAGFAGDDASPAGEALRADAPGLAALVARAVQVKADVVAADPREAGVRAHLNLGHTLAHALETASAHRLPHGEAVAYGLAFVAELGVQRGWADWRREARALLAWVRPAALPEVPFDELLTLMARDKKRLGERRRLVLLRRVGEPQVVDDVSEEALHDAWQALVEVVHDLGAQRP
jgi:3-dehydroquinate synthase